MCSRYSSFLKKPSNKAPRHRYSNNLRYLSDFKVTKPVHDKSDFESEDLRLFTLNLKTIGLRLDNR